MEREQTERFSQDLDSLIAPKENIRESVFLSQPRNYLEIGTVVDLTNNTTDVEIIEVIAMKDDKIYDYHGAKLNSDNNVKDYYFDIENVERVKPKKERSFKK